MSERFQEIARQLSETSRAFYARGWVLGTSGNFSAVIERNPLRLAMSPSGVDKGSLRPEEVLLIDEHAAVVSDHRAKPSDESPLHIRIALEREAGAVLHTHSVWSTILSDQYAEHGELRIEGYEMLKGLAGVKTHEHCEKLPIIENAQNMVVLAETISQSLQNNEGAHGFMLRRHGLYTWGKDLAEAKRHVEILEFLLETLGRTRLMTDQRHQGVYRWQ